MMVAEMELCGMKFHSFHGCLEEEKREGNDFVVDFRCSIDIEKAAASDELADTLDYSEIYDIVAAQMAVPSNLLENVSYRISEAISKAHPELEHFEVKVSKKNPPVNGEAQWSAVTVRK